VQSQFLGDLIYAAAICRAYSSNNSRFAPNSAASSKEAGWYAISYRSVPPAEPRTKTAELLASLQHLMANGSYEIDSTSLSQQARWGESPKCQIS
jgi:hypothetical protein